MTETQRTPKRVQMSRQHPWRAEHPDAVIVARPTRWGNPYRIGDENPHTGEPIADRDEATMYFRAQLEMLAALVPDHYAAVVERIRDGLAGRDLACWCPLDQPCHADVLLEIANGPRDV